MIASLRPASPQLVVVAAAVLIAAACGRDAGSASSDTASAQNSSAAVADSVATLRGSVVSASATALVIATDSGSVTVKLTQPFELYDRVSGNLANVKDNSFVGVTSVKQPDGSEKATEIHIFPEELRGLGEGSRMMAQSVGAGGSRMTNGAMSGSRMTNGAMSGSRMTNGTAMGSRMSNGNVSSASSSNVVVEYSGGSRKITVPPNTPVTEIKPTSKTLAPGDKIVVLAKKGADGSFSANRALLAGK